MPCRCSKECRPDREALASIENSLEICARSCFCPLLQSLHPPRFGVQRYPGRIPLQHGCEALSPRNLSPTELRRQFWRIFATFSEPEKKRRAISHLRDALRIEPDRYALANLAEVFTPIGELDQALVHYKEAAGHRLLC